MDEPKRGKFGEPWEYKEHRGYGELLNGRGQLVMETSQSKELMRHVSACVNALHSSGLTPAQLAEVGPLVEAISGVVLACEDWCPAYEKRELKCECGFKAIREALDRFDAAGEGE